MNIFLTFLTFFLLTSPTWGLNYYANSTVVTTQVTVTDFTTYCPEETTVTITSCKNHVCSPTTIVVTEETTLTITGEVVCPTTITNGVGETTKTPDKIADGATTTHYYTVTDYTTYCPESTVFTVTKCNNGLCHPSPITVTEPTTVTVTGEIVCSTPPPEKTLSTTTYTKQAIIGGTTVYLTKTDYTTYCPESTVLTLTKCVNHQCTPTQISVSSAQTITVTGEVIVETVTGGDVITHATTITSVVVPTPIAETKVYTTKSQSVHTSTITQTGYTTYCPLPTVLTLTTCDYKECHPTTYSATGGETVTLSNTVLQTTLSSSEVEVTVTSVSPPPPPATTTTDEDDIGVTVFPNVISVGESAAAIAHVGTKETPSPVTLKTVAPQSTSLEQVPGSAAAVTNPATPEVYAGGANSISFGLHFMLLCLAFASIIY
ncbi:hypothetical protein KGF56_004858 [Candida oxycetoniae]|uniref:Uncharacterized protein n=1 Tax=Candida oxycetoniae TaxID=497107 RepID=A0AAI9WVA1_9ASCO|nr:uncharacterized protein KGF56_004858 [Candida oxycetoniae]KAI3402288.2 hypothetical protein KGF56_004858 [Candida oxycetoniae]